VVTGFRLAWGGAQEAYGVTPDLCTLGKVIGGGFPLAAIAGRADLMDHFDKAAVGADKWLMQVGTLSGNPVAAAAGLKTLEILARPGAYDALRATGARLMDATTSALTAAGVPHTLVGDPTLFEAVFAEGPVRDYRAVQAQDGETAARFAEGLRAGGVFKSAGKTYPCLALTAEDIALVEAAAHAAAAALR
jgi:glutamate-1-semialdehyde 2,1-aminomutase